MGDMETAGHDIADKGRNPEMGMDDIIIDVIIHHETRDLIGNVSRIVRDIVGLKAHRQGMQMDYMDIAVWCEVFVSPHRMSENIYDETLFTQPLSCL